MVDMFSAWRGADLALLGALDVLLEEANVTRAAARLHLSQPALSAQLARLRQLTGDRLLVPATHGRGMILTARALAIRPSLRAALQGVQAAMGQGVGFDPGQDARRFQLVASDNGMVMVGIDLIRHITACAPKVQLGFQSVASAQLGARLDSGQADLVIAADFSIPAGLQARPLLRESYVMAQRKGHPRGLAPPDLAEYSALLHVIVSGDGGHFHGFMDDLLKRQGYQRRVAVSVQQYHLAPLVLEASDCVCVLPRRFLARFADRLDLLPVPLEVDAFSLSAAWHPRHADDAAHRWLRETLFAVAAQGGSLASPVAGRLD